MDLLYVSHPSSRAHDTGRRHPERPQRLEAVRAGVDRLRWNIRDIEAPRVSRELLEAVHDPGYVRAIEELAAQGGSAVDADTVVSPGSWEAALRSAGAVVAAVDELAAHRRESALVATRPPGHHASAAKAMGFCLFNNVMVGAEHLRQRGERVAIVDWDVHHGNGTQDLVETRPDVLYVSIHQSPFYPFAGDYSSPSDIATNLVNIPLPAGTAGDVYRAAFDDLVVPRLLDHGPDWVLVSCGFDAHAADLLAEMRLVAADYQSMARELTRVVSPNRIVLVLEGGYDLVALADSTEAALIGLTGAAGDGPLKSPERSWEALEMVAMTLSAPMHGAEEV